MRKRCSLAAGIDHKINKLKRISHKPCVVKSGSTRLPGIHLDVDMELVFGEEPFMTPTRNLRYSISVSS